MRGEPSTNWRESIAPDEEARFARQAQKLAPAHAALSARYGAGRLLHRKPVLAARGTFEILDGLPDYARHGLFAAPRVYEALARFSNGGATVEPNAKPDIRGVAIKALGVAGPGGARRRGRDAGLPAGQSDEFRRPRQRRVRRRRRRRAAAARPAVAFGLVRRHGLVGGLKRIWRLAAKVGRPFAGFAAETFDSAGGVRRRPVCGARAADPGQPGAGRRQGFRRRPARPPRRRTAGLRAGAAVLRRRGDDADRGSDRRLAARSRPPLVVAQADAEAVEADVEGLRFDPWGGLADHRPLGEIMRARKAAYFHSQKARGAL